MPFQTMDGTGDDWTPNTRMQRRSNRELSCPRARQARNGPIGAYLSEHLISVVLKIPLVFSIPACTSVASFAGAAELLQERIHAVIATPRKKVMARVWKMRSVRSMRAETAERSSGAALA